MLCFLYVCYLFKETVGEQKAGDSFINVGFSNWKETRKL